MTPVPGLAAAINASLRPASSPTLPVALASPPSQAAPAPAAGTTNVTYRGTVEDQATGRVLSGVLVTVAAANCQNGCTSAYTDVNGRYSVNGPACPVTLDFILDTYMENQYFVPNEFFSPTCTVGSTVSVPIVKMTMGGWVTGTVRGTDPTHKPISGVKITSASRNSTSIMTPAAFSASDGTFRVIAPAVPGILEFSPPCCAWLSTRVYVNATAYGTMSIGTVYLQTGVLVSVSVYSSTTRASAAGGGATIEGCSRITGLCFTQGTLSGGNPLYAWVPVGPVTLQTRAINYVMNVSEVGPIPNLPLGSIYHLPSVYLTPDAVLRVEVNLTGGALATPAANYWGVGYAAIIVQSDDGYHAVFPSPANPFNLSDSLSFPSGASGGCVPLHTPVLLLAQPLRDYIDVEPDTGQCFIPPSWPIPPGLPVWGNHTIVNATAGKITNVGTLDLTPGTYVLARSNVGSPAGPPNAPGVISMSDCSTDELGWCGNGAYSTTTPGYDPTGCPVSNNYVCTPVPFGPSVLTAQAPGFVTNFTNLYVPWFDYKSMPMPISSVTVGHLQEIDLIHGRISGRVLIAGTTQPPQGFMTVQSCPAGQPPAQYQCTSGVVDLRTGNFQLNTSFGWQQVTVSDPFYKSNWTWVYVAASGTNSTGTIYVTPLAFVQGRVVDPSGRGVLEAQAYECPIGAPTACVSLGLSGITNTSGGYFALATPNPVPLGSFELLFTEPGFTSNWTWVNVTTPGQIVTASTVVIAPLGNASVAAPAQLQGSLASQPRSSPIVHSGEWITGRVVDAVSLGGGWNQLPLPVASINAQPVLGGNPTTFGDPMQANGQFNGSLLAGLYWLNLSVQGYYPATVYLNVTGLDPNGTMTIPTVGLTPYAWLRGRVLIDPASWRTGVTERYGLGPGATSVSVCQRASGGACGPTSPVDLGGFFNVSAPYGHYNRVQVSPGATGIGTMTGGFVSNQSAWNVTNYTKELDASHVSIGVAIFGGVFGIIYDASTQNTSPVRYPAHVSALSTNPKTRSITVGCVTNGGGEFFGILENATKISVAASGDAFLNSSITNLTIAAGDFTDAGNMSLRHYGWVETTTLLAGLNTILPYTKVVVTLTLKSGLSVSSSGVSNGWGIANITAPPGVNETVLVGATGDFNATWIRNVTVNQSETTYVGNVTGTFQNAVNVSSWPWVFGTILDGARHTPLQGANTIVTSTYLASGSATQSSGSGAFVIDAPPGANDTLTVSLSPDYLSNSTQLSLTYGEIYGLPPTNLTVNLTGDGIIAGYVVAYPTGVIVPFASISVCPVTQPNCPNVAQANGSGWFWAAGKPGYDLVNVSAPDFVANTSIRVNLTADSWVWIGKVILEEYAFVTGEVLGLPSGIPVAGANVSGCTLPLIAGEPDGPCLYSVQTLIGGTFFLPLQAGSYILQVNATLYNATYLPISVAAGEILPVGSVFLQLFGFAAGSVMSAETGAPVSGALVTACATWATGNCTAPAVTDGSGHYRIAGPPGPYIEEVSANGFFNQFQRILLVSGALVAVPSIYMLPIGTGQHYLVEGLVLSAANGSAPVVLPGALVSDGVGDATGSAADGSFALSVVWGAYGVTAAAPGYASETIHVTVHQNVTGLRFVLSPMTFVVQGIISDGLDHLPIANATLAESGQVLGATDLNGHYQIPLTNGSHLLEVAPPAGEAAFYAPLAVALVVNGAPFTHDLTLVPPQAPVTVIVTDAATGLPIANASATVTGTTYPENTPVTSGFTTLPMGTFVATLYSGNYSIAVTAHGYSKAAVAFSVAGGGATSVAVALAPVPATAAAGTSNPYSPLVLGAMAVTAAAAGLIYLALGRRWRASEAGPSSAATAGGPP